ncbi:hypothetical protein PENANT_c021G06494 [Penicillium antarcticum]|uniref:Transcription factor domain-containing protein n=1 Tax=Penicillium antarcticum TaxID=416450 RepID=A0A1V6PZR5_9EURO|nr:hypothetical protein PENANT_c021G06494 [Penicillium antarcticum]
MSNFPGRFGRFGRPGQVRKDASVLSGTKEVHFLDLILASADVNQDETPTVTGDSQYAAGVKGTVSIALGQQGEEHTGPAQAEIRTNLDGAHQDFLDQSLEEIRHIMPQDANREQLTTPNSEDIPQRGTAAVSSPTYVGKASDIHFIHSIRQCVQGREQFAGEDALAQNYSETHVSESLAALKHPLLFPSPAEADQFLEVYLSTIHIAYPFISKSGLLEAFRRFQAKDVHKPEFRPWLAMFRRPMAIHEADFHVELPSAIDEAPWGSLGNEGPIATRPSERGCMMEYFLEVIRFSHIVGLVIRGLYQPSQVDLSPDIMLHSASGLDRRLNEWKDSLPRNLRFDLGHTFEKSISFKRQVGASSH